MLSGFFYEFLCNCRACGNSCKASKTGKSEDGLPVVQAAHTPGTCLLRGEMLTTLCLSVSQEWKHMFYAALCVAEPVDVYKAGLPRVKYAGEPRMVRCVMQGTSRELIVAAQGASGQEAQHHEQSSHIKPRDRRRPRRGAVESQDHGAVAQANSCAGHSAAREQAEPGSAASASKAPGRQNTKMAKHGKGQSLHHDEQVHNSSAANRRAQPLPNSSAGKERKGPARAMNGGRSDEAKSPTAKATASSRTRSARRPAAQLYQPAGLAQSEQAAKADLPAQVASPQAKQSSRRRRQPAVPDSPAQAHAEDTAAAQQAQSRPKKDRQRAEPAPEQHAGSRSSAEGSSLPKKLLSELVKEVQGLNARSDKSKAPARVPNAVPESESTGRRGRKSGLAAPPGL